MSRDGFEQIDAVMRPFGCKGAPKPSPCILGRGRKGRQTTDSAACQRRVPVLFWKVQPVWRQGPVRCPALFPRGLLAGLVGIARQGPSLDARRLRLVIQEDCSPLGKIVEQSLQVGIEEW